MSLPETVQELRRVTGGSLGCGWMCDEVARFINALVQFYKPDLVIQTGHLWGKSAAAILDAFTPDVPLETDPQTGDPRFAAFLEQRRPRPARQRLVSIDPRPIEVPHPHSGVAHLMAEYGDSFEFVNLPSTEFFATFAPAPHEQRIMGVVDGDHSDAGCRADMVALGKLNAGLIVVDDVTWIPALREVAERFAADNGYGCAVFPDYNGLAVLTRG